MPKILLKIVNYKVCTQITDSVNSEMTTTETKRNKEFSPNSWNADTILKDSAKKKITDHPQC